MSTMVALSPFLSGAILCRPIPPERRQTWVAVLPSSEQLASATGGCNACKHTAVHSTALTAFSKSVASFFGSASRRGQKGQQERRRWLQEYAPVTRGAFLLCSGDLNDWSRILCGLFRVLKGFAIRVLELVKGRNEIGNTSLLYYPNRGTSRGC